MDFIRNQFGSGPRFKVHMFEHDVSRMKKLVLRHPAKETGGNLFGLWTDDGEPVLHVVLGPAIGCTRTEVSFYQSIPYLERVGGLLTHQYQLCHIGEWHSHHRLRLSEPSTGDSTTVIRNYPRGTCGFLLIIANIRSWDVTLSPYLYKEGQRDYKRGEVNVLHGQSPFRAVDVILSNILQDEDTSTSVNEHRPSSREGNRPREGDRPISAVARPTAADNEKNAYVYMFDEDRKMIEGMLADHGTENGSEGKLFGLWTNDEEPVVHVVLQPTDKKKDPQPVPSGDHPLATEEKEKGGESLSVEYPSLQNIGKYILRRQQLGEAHKPTPEEVSSVRREFPNGGVLIIAHTVVEESVGCGAYIFNKGPDSCQSLEIKYLFSPKVFNYEQKKQITTEEKESTKGSENEKMDVDPQDPPGPNLKQDLITL